MEQNKHLIGVLVVLLAVWVAGVSASPPSAEAYNRGVQIPDVPGWQQVNSSGFGDPQTEEVTALETFNGFLYAGTHNPIDPALLFDGAQIFRSSDGLAWTAVTLPGFGNSHDIAPPAILDFVVFNNRLYASTGRGNASQVWRSQNGTIWAPMDVTGFSNPDNVDVTALAVYGSKIYAGVTNQVTSAQVWSSFTGDNNSWFTVTVPVLADSIITGFAEFDGGLYAAVESPSPAQLWVSYGGPWSAAMSNGFGDSDTIWTGGMGVFGGYLYVGAGNAVDGAQLWRSNNGIDWSQSISPGFGDSNNQKVELVYVFENQLYASVTNSVTGLEIWRSSDGTTWEQVNQDGFGDTNNTHSNWSNATAEFLGQLYIGTLNILDGGELWRMQQPYGVNLSPDDTQVGIAGQTINYTLWVTNTGTMNDTFNLALAGQNWTTTVSIPSISLTPGASGQFNVAVSIPSDAMGSDTDMVSLTATSQGNPTKSDSAFLTTTVLPFFGLDLSPSTTSAGLPGTTVTYTLKITNTGNVADSFNLSATGQTWITTLSTSQVGLAPTASAPFTVTVAIPPSAVDQETDSVTITATSQGDSGKTDSADLTTTSVTTPVYGVALSADDTLSAPVGGQVIYTLMITNTGNVADTFDLAVSGQTWVTTLSTLHVSLAPENNTVFSIIVAIPPDAVDQETDIVSITATSRGDVSKKDTAVLTTVSVSTEPFTWLYLPIIVLNLPP